MLLAWMIVAQITQILVLFPWWCIFIYVYVYSEGDSPGLIVTLASYPAIVLGSSIWAWITYRRAKSKQAGWIIAIPIVFVLLYILAIETGILD